MAGGGTHGEQNPQEGGREVSDQTDEGGATAPPRRGAASEKLVLVQLSTVAPEEVDYLWPGRIPRGKLTIIMGNPGEGKSYLTLDMAARITTGKAWPDGGQAPLGKVILFSAEDGIADTIRPRVDALGGDPANVLVMQKDQALSLKKDLVRIEGAVSETKPLLVVIDPVSAYMGGIDPFKDTEVRSVLAPLAAMAEKYRIAIVVVMHLTKDAQKQLIYRAPGSIAFVGQARAVFVVLRDPEDTSTEYRRYFAPGKFNIGAVPNPLAFRILADKRLVWESAPPGLDVEAILRGAGVDGDSGELHRAAEFLQELLKDGPVLSEEVEKTAKDQSISRSTLKRAKTKLGVRARRLGGVGGKGAWVWELPAKGTKTENVIPLAQPHDTQGESPAPDAKKTITPCLSPLEREMVPLDVDGHQEDNVAW
jgi:putative DNA primase/helicase